MFKSQIIQIYRGYDSDKIGMGKKHDKEYDDVIKYEKAMLEKIGDDEQFKKLLSKYDLAVNNLNYADIEDIFQEGFKLGARLAMEICGVECEED